MSIFSNWAEWRGLLPAEEETSVKLRKDCRFAALVEDDKGKFYWRCDHRTARFKPDPDYVTGKAVVEYQLPCRLARWDETRCGPEAILGTANRLIGPERSASRARPRSRRGNRVLRHDLRPGWSPVTGV